jgi:hypothetical protein
MSRIASLLATATIFVEILSLPSLAGKMAAENFRTAAAQKIVGRGTHRRHQRREQDCNMGNCKSLRGWWLTFPF